MDENITRELNIRVIERNTELMRSNYLFWFGIIFYIEKFAYQKRFL